MGSPSGKKGTGRSYRDLTTLGSRPNSPDGHGHTNGNGDGSSDLPADDEGVKRLYKWKVTTAEADNLLVDGEVNGLGLRAKAE